MTPPSQNRAITHDDWAATFDKLVEDNGIDSAVGEVSYFCAQVLKLCGDTPELKEFIDKRTLYAFEAVEEKRNGS